MLKRKIMFPKQQRAVLTSFLPIRNERLINAGKIRIQGLELHLSVADPDVSNAKCVVQSRQRFCGQVKAL